MEEEMEVTSEPYSGGSSDEYVPSDIQNSSTSSESEEVEVMQKKNRKSVDKSKWARNQKKKMLATGQKHLNTSNKMIGPRVVGADCKCKFKCFEKVDEQERELVLQKFNEIGEKVMQDTYLVGLISTSEVTRRRPKSEQGRQRNVSHQYRVSYYQFIYLVHCGNRALCVSDSYWSEKCQGL